MTEQLPASYAILRVYDRDGVTLRDEFDVSGVSWTDELGGEGSAQYSVSLVQRAMQSDPNLLRDAVVKVAVPLAYGAAPTEIFAWLSNPGSGVLVGDTQDAAMNESPASRGLMSLFDDWIMLPENGYRRTSATSRWIGWMSKQGAWYEAADWHAPASVRTQASFKTHNRRRYGYPVDWPDGSSNWISDAAGDGRVTLFRTTFTTTIQKLVDVYFSADETYVAYLNGEEVMGHSAVEIGFQAFEHFEYPVVLNAGTHTLAVAMTTVGTPIIGDGVDMLMCTVYAIGASGQPEELLRRSDGTNWKATHMLMDADRPGWTAADIVIGLVDEASARGIDSMDGINFSFTGDEDSDGNPWNQLEERVWNIGTSGTQILADLSDTNITFDMRPDFTLDAYLTQGVNRTHFPTCPTLLPGYNLLGYTWTGQPVLATRVLVRTAEAYSFLTDSYSEEQYSPREAYLESGTSVSVSQGVKVGNKLLAEHAIEHRNYTAEIIAKPGCVPYVDFFKGDVIWGLNHVGEREALRVVSIGGARGDDGGLIRWMIELRELVAQRRPASDLAPSVDTLAVRVSLHVTAADSAPAVATVTRGRSIPRAIAQTAPSIDTVARTKQAPRTAADSAPATDGVVGIVT